MLVRRLVDFLMLLPASDVQEFLGIAGIEGDQAIRRQFVEQSLNIHRGNIVTGEDFGLDGLGAGHVVAGVVAEVPQPDEQQASHRRAFHHLQLLRGA